MIRHKVTVDHHATSERGAIAPAEHRASITFAPAEPRRTLHRDVLCLFGLLVITGIVFYKVLLFGDSVSKCFLLAEWDSLFDKYRTGKSILCDPSIPQLFVPTYKLIADVIHTGNLPLWDPFVGFGQPLIGDIQANVFSPLRLLFYLFPSMYMYNLTLVAQVGIGACFTYILSRRLQLGAPAAVLAATCFALSPFNMWYLELLSGPAVALSPLIAYLFVWAGEKRTFGSIVLAGAACAALVFAAHPESTFWSITVCSAFLFGVMMSGPGSLLTKVLAFGRTLASIGLVTFLLAAPVLLPFGEYMLNSDCYKYEKAFPARIQWPAIFLNLMTPAFCEASGFIGSIAAVLLPVSFFIKGAFRKYLWAVAGTCAFAIICTARLEPINALFSIKAFNVIINSYCGTMLLLFISLLSGFGLQAALKNDSGFKLWISVLVAAIVVVAVPSLVVASGVSLAPFHYDTAIPPPVVNMKVVMRDVALLAGFGVAVAVAMKIRRFQFALLAVAVISLNLVSLAAVNKKSMPLQPSFDYPPVPAYDYIQQFPGRMIATGNHLGRPVANIAYGIQDARSLNAMYPKRYATFMDFVGADRERFTQTFGTKLPPSLGLASVKYVVTQKDAVGQNAGYELVASFDNDIKLFENKNALPQAYVAHRALVSTSSKETGELLSSTDFNPHHSVIVEGEGAVAFDKPDAVDDVQINRVSANQVDVVATTSQPGYLVLTDAFYPGWQATINGTPARILRANYMFRAVALEPGTNQVIFRYQPLSFMLGLCAASSVLLAAVAHLLWSRVYRTRRILDRQP
jgi:hypothetical protein